MSDSRVCSTTLMYNVMFYITNKTQELFFYNRTDHSRVHQLYIGATNSCANFADKLNNCTLQQNARLQQNWTTLKVKSIQISGGPSKTSVCPDPRIGYWSSHNSCMQEPAILHGTTTAQYANKVFCFDSKILNLTHPDSGWIWTMTGGIVSSSRSSACQS